MAWLVMAMALLVLFGGMWVYHIGNEHGKEVRDLQLKLGASESSLKNATDAIRKKNAYIKTIERALVDGALPQDIALLLNRMFEGEDNPPTSHLSGIRASGKTGTGLRLTGRRYGGTVSGKR